MKYSYRDRSSAYSVRRGTWPLGQVFSTQALGLCPSATRSEDIARRGV